MKPGRPSKEALKAMKKKAMKKKSSKLDVKAGRVNSLTAHQFMFCQEYLVDLCAKDAAKRAGYSEKTAKEAGYRLLQREDIKQEIERLLEERANRCGVHADRVVQELACIAFADIADCLSFSAHGVTLKPSNEINEKARRAISEVRETVTMAGTSVSFKLNSKVEALKTLAQHLGMTKQQVEHSVSGDAAKVVFFPSNGRELPQGE